ncbi:urease accessory protein UreF [Pannus brasiliensis CCIBt3594]|uniref:Urease accessory protein UreF n=1 Tax=Pannus brasiliensis CCIBt3594 TaxID=1427578 RepID=A0AAW9QST6_9CHRO
MSENLLDKKEILCLLQLASSTLPVGAYSYSEGLETLVERGVISGAETLGDWLGRSLARGSIRVETAVLRRVYHCFRAGDLAGVTRWDAWLSATRETAELRQQSAQMGRSLLKLSIELHPDLTVPFADGCNYATAFAIAAVTWEISEETAILGYLQSWASNLITAGVRTIPLGQTAGQSVLLKLQPRLLRATEEILQLPDDRLESWSWGLSLASIAHETQYSRLFRS